MIRTLQRRGTTVALIFDKGMLEALHMTADMPLHITFHDGVMTVAPTHVGIPQTELGEAIEELRPHYKTMLSNLAK